MNAYFARERRHLRCPGFYTDNPGAGSNYVECLA